MGKGSPTPDRDLPDTYEFTLSKDLKEIAKKELRETSKTREQALEQMRHWIDKTEFIKNCRTDANFLLRFLRVKKFSVPLAQETLLKYIAMRQQHAHWFHNTSLKDPLVLDLVNRGVAFAVPERDKNGRRVMFTIGGNIDPNIHTSESVMKAIMLAFESFLEDEENQIRGFTHILDEGGITFSHLVLWNPTEIAKIFSTTEKSMPMRHKSLDFISLPTLLNYVFEFAKTLMSEKLRTRIRVHKDLPALQDAIDKKILPKEYGGTIPLAEMIEMYKDEISGSAGRIEALDEMRLDMEIMKQSSSSASKKVASDILGMTGSFKKLEID